MQTAVATSGNLTSYMLPPGSATYANSAFLLLHFAELDPSASNTSREFYIDIGDGREPTLMNPYTDSKTPGPYSRTSWLFWDRTIGPTTLLTLYPTAVSLRGPILNAMEVFSVPDTRHASTLDRDGKLKSSLKLLCRKIMSVQSFLIKNVDERIRFLMCIVLFYMN